MHSQTISTAFQSTISIVKMVYFLLAPRKFYMLLRRACRHELLLECELFEVVAGLTSTTLLKAWATPNASVVLADLPIAKTLRQQVEDTMNRCWINKRRQLLSYLVTCSCILLNYFVTSVAINLYHYAKQDQENFDVVLREFPKTKQ